MAEFFLFIFGVFIFWYARTAKLAARAAEIRIDKLLREINELREYVTRKHNATGVTPPPPTASTEATMAIPPIVMPTPTVQASWPRQDSASAAESAGAADIPPAAAAPPPPAPIPQPEEATDNSVRSSAMPSIPPAHPDAESSDASFIPADIASPTWLLTAKAWLFGGNLVAKLGLLILFIGISFLLKYTAARVTVPIEWRLAAIVLADIALLTWGWRIRERRSSISLPVQGTALAILMLVTFGAFRLYHLIPGSLAFALLFLLTAFTCVLSVLQNSQWLAIFGIVGGFAAPLLASSGGGSHIGLFSYYALLNAGVFGLALLRSWRPLNLLGFAFTFVIGTTWGVLRYQPENYLSVQLFLILFFLYYVSIALAYARQQALRLKHYVDATLVFGTPMLAFGLQFALTRAFPFGVAYSALALGLFYIGLATLLGRQRNKYDLLADTFLALGVVFGTLAIPFALDGRWTSAAWALEGAGIVWVGLRQRQRLTWMFGLLVQAGAWLSFIGAVAGMTPLTVFDANLWLGFCLLAITAFLMAIRFRALQAPDAPVQQRPFTLLAGVFLAFATMWLLAGAWTEIFLRTDAITQANLLVASALATAIVLGLISRRMAWRLAGTLAMQVQGLAGVTLLILSFTQWDIRYTPVNLLDTPILGALMILGGAMFSGWNLTRHREPGIGASQIANILLAWSGLWWFGMILPILAGWLALHYQLLLPNARTRAWPLWPIYAVLVAAGTAPLLLLARRLRWPALRWSCIATWAMLLGMTVSMLDILYGDYHLPSPEQTAAWLSLWLAAEWLLRAWPTDGWHIGILKLLHTLRTAGPWLMIWPVASICIARWLADGNNPEARLLADSGWQTSASWARFMPAWLMMAALAWLMRRAQADSWPVRPVAQWYRQCLIPLACGWSLLLVAVWNLTQDGAMAPLPYLPLLNPLDLSSAFAMLLAFACYRMLTNGKPAPATRTRFVVAGALVACCWFNLALLRAAAHYLGLAYDFNVLFASHFVQAMLSLLWSVMALLMMHYAADRMARRAWIAGAMLLGLVVGKLFLVDLSNVGGIERIISFLGVGALMVGIGYLAPYPVSRATQTS